MQFWTLEVFNRFTRKRESYFVQSNHDRERLVDVLSQAHPEWDDIKVEKTEKPEGIKEWN